MLFRERGISLSVNSLKTGLNLESRKNLLKTYPRTTPPEINVAHMLEYDRMIILFEFLEVLIGNICYTFKFEIVQGIAHNDHSI